MKDREINDRTDVHTETDDLAKDLLRLIGESKVTEPKATAKIIDLDKLMTKLCSHIVRRDHTIWNAAYKKGQDDARSK